MPNLPQEIIDMIVARVNRPSPPLLTSLPLEVLRGLLIYIEKEHTATFGFIIKLADLKEQVGDENYANWTRSDFYNTIKSLLGDNETSHMQWYNMYITDLSQVYYESQ